MHRESTEMRLKKYIQGARKGKEANRLEREAMSNPFLSDAIDGYDRVKGNHIADVDCLRDRIIARSQKPSNRYFYVGIAVGLSLLVGLGLYFFVNNDPSVNDMIVYENNHVVATPPTQSFPVEVEIEVTLSDSSISQPAIVQKKENVFTEPETLSQVQEEALVSIQDIEDISVLSRQDASIEEDTVEKSVVELLAEAEAEKSMVDEEVIIGYGVQKKSPMTGSISSVKVMAEEKDTNGEDFDVKTVEIKKMPTNPKPTIGNKAYEKYLKKNMIRPTDGVCATVSGVVVVSFYVHDGRPYNFTITQSLCPSADEEALRLIKEGPDWTNGEDVMTINVRF